MEDASSHDLNGNGGPDLRVLVERSHQIILEEDMTCLVDAKTLRLCAIALLHLCDALEENMHHRE